MTARTGMVNLLRRLRGMTQVGTAQYTVGGATWWSDDQLQEVLDIYAADYFQAATVPQSEIDSGGTVRYFNYYSGIENTEEYTSGTVYWYVHNGAGSVVGTADYVPNHINGAIRFNADTAGSAYYVRARAYDMNRAAAQIWQEMAGNTAAMYSFQSDNQRFNRSEWWDHCMKMANRFEVKAGIDMNTIERSDLMCGDG